MRPLVLTLLLLAGCAGQHVEPGPDLNSTLSPTTTIQVSGSKLESRCQLRSNKGHHLPDPACTPGATNPEVTQANISSTICSPGWASRQRPSSSKTAKLKAVIAADYGVTYRSGMFDELDHLISIQLGGALLDPANLWVEPGDIPNPKDAVEGRLNDKVCRGEISLASAQQLIASDWTQLL